MHAPVDLAGTDLRKRTTGSPCDHEAADGQQRADVARRRDRASRFLDQRAEGGVVVLTGSIETMSQPLGLSGERIACYDADCSGS